jgi:lysine 2,3-aminomutase
LDESIGYEDPLAEEDHRPVASIVHRYGDRVLFLITHFCEVHCRFCTRRRLISHPQTIDEKAIYQGFRYIQRNNQIRDVLISGGDPFLLPQDKLEWILKNVRSIPHVRMIRIGSRLPSVAPYRITDSLAEMLGKYHPLYINIHFNHPDEITEAVERACITLSNQGIPLGSQTVLLKGINDQPEIILDLVQKLIEIRVRPYYLLQCDPVVGTAHFWTSPSTGLGIVDFLRGQVSGLAIPQFVIDLPEGGGKIPLVPDCIVETRENYTVFRNYQDKLYTYPLSFE